MTVTLTVLGFKVVEDNDLEPDELRVIHNGVIVAKFYNCTDGLLVETDEQD